MDNRIAIVSPLVPEICEKLKCFGYKLIYTDCVDEFISYEKYHADMQCVSLNDGIFVLNGCKRLIDNLKATGVNIIESRDCYNGKYPENVKLNVKIIGNYVIGKESAFDSLLFNILAETEHTFIDVKQGYAGCSCAKINDKAIITSDNSIYKGVKNTKIECLKIRDGHIKLYGAPMTTTGFIGGASVQLDENNILFFGNIKKHPDYIYIDDFCIKHKVQIHYIEEIPLTDIGGAVLLNISQ